MQYLHPILAASVPIPGLGELLWVLGASVFAVLVLERLKLPAILGFLIAGAAIGPDALGLVQDRTEIERLAEIGVALLLFTIGLHFSLKDLMQMGRIVFGGGTAQVLLTMAVVAAIARGLGADWSLSLLFGALAALSSTAIVMRLLQEQGSAASPSGRVMIGMLLFQDLAIVPLMLLVPLLNPDPSVQGTPIGQTLLTAGLVLVTIVVLGRWIFPWLLDKVVVTRSSELFTLTTLLLALGTAMFAAAAGLSLALGAFLAGIVLADSEYSHQILGEIAPFRDAFTGLFFVSIGMLLDPAVFQSHLGLVLGIGFSVFVVKALIVGTITLFLGYGPRVALIAGCGLAQIGEFSFLLGQAGVKADAIGEAQYQPFIAVTILLMAAAPFMLQLGPWLANRWIPNPPVPPEARVGPSPEPTTAPHVVVIGYGLNGRNVARVLREVAIPFRVVELNPQLVRRARAEGVPVLWGDATRRAVLEQAGMSSARAVVVAIEDAAATRQITALAHEINAPAHIAVRTRYLRELPTLLALGADVVVPEEFETSLALVREVLSAYGAAEASIVRLQDQLRAEGYATLQTSYRPAATLPAFESLPAILASLESQELLLPADSIAIGQTLRQLHLRRRTGATLLAVRRGGTLYTSLDLETPFEAEDLLVLIGTGGALHRAEQWLTHGTEPTETPTQLNLPSVTPPQPS